MNPKSLAIIVTTAVAAGFGLATLSLPNAMAQDSGHGAPDAAEMQDMMARWEKARTPGEQHKFLMHAVGTWDTTMKMWMGGPGGAPMESTGTSVITSYMDGRFTKEEFSGTFMGAPMTGLGIAGYDNFKKKFTNFWLDNMNTATYFSEGLLDQTGQTLTLFGSMDEPMTGEHDKTVKYVTRIIDADTRLFEIHDLGIVPGDTRVVEITYRRQQP